MTSTVKQMRDIAPPPTIDFDLFLKSYKPRIRPEGYEQDLARAFEIDVRFMEEFRCLRRYLLADENNWGEDICLHLSRQGALPDTVTPQDERKLSSLYRQHSANFKTGKFDVNYLDSIETIALFYIYHNVRTLWLVGAYREQTSRLIDLVCERATMNQRIPLRGTMHALTSALTLEFNQIQRTFTMYERYVSDALVSDLKRTGMLTQAPRGMVERTQVEV